MTSLTTDPEVAIRVGQRWYRVNVEEGYILGQRAVPGHPGRMAWTTFWTKKRGTPGPLAQELIAQARRKT